MRTVPRSLADDLLNLCVQDNAADDSHIWRTTQAAYATYGFITDMGGAARAKKTWLFGSDGRARRILALIRLPGQEHEAVQVHQQSRDIGAHLDHAAPQWYHAH